MMRLLTPHEVAVMLNLSYEAALSFIKYSGIDYLKIGRQYRVSEAKLTAFVNRKGQHTVDLTENI